MAAGNDCTLDTSESDILPRPPSIHDSACHSDVSEDSDSSMTTDLVQDISIDSSISIDTCAESFSSTIAPVPSSQSTNKCFESSTPAGPTGPKQPRINFPKDRHNRKFNPVWYTDYKWLEYSIAMDATFCYACKHFGKREGKSKEDAFTIKGYNAWKTAVGDISKGLPQHNKCQTHLKPIRNWGAFIKRQLLGQRLSN